jgi:hypothetical protein
MSTDSDFQTNSYVTTVGVTETVRRAMKWDEFMQTGVAAENLDMEDWAKMLPEDKRTNLWVSLKRAWARIKESEDRTRKIAEYLAAHAKRLDALEKYCPPDPRERQCLTVKKYRLSGWIAPGGGPRLRISELFDTEALARCVIRDADRDCHKNTSLTVTEEDVPA